MSQGRTLKSEVVSKALHWSCAQSGVVAQALLLSAICCRASQDVSWLLLPGSVGPVVGGREEEGLGRDHVVSVC